MATQKQQHTQTQTNLKLGHNERNVWHEEAMCNIIAAHQDIFVFIDNYSHSHNSNKTNILCYEIVQV